MTVQSKDERTDRVTVFSPRLGASLWKHTHPGRDLAVQFALNVGLFRVNLLHFMTVNEAVGITGLCRFKCGGAEPSSWNSATSQLS